MDKTQIRKDIEGLIQNIKEHFDNTLSQDHIPQLELETIVKKIEKLHQKAIIFHYLNGLNNQDSRTDLNSRSPHQSRSAHEAQVVQESGISRDNSPKSENAQTDLFGGSLGSKSPEKQTSKTEDIRSGIGINDKFQFIAELFEGNENEYTAAINQLNTYPSYSDAEAYLNSIRGIYKWKDDNTFADKFLKIVRKKLR